MTAFTPPEGASSDLAELYAPKTDVLKARHTLRTLPEASAAAAERIEAIEIVVASAPGVESAVALVREGAPPRPLRPPRLSVTASGIRHAGAAVDCGLRRATRRRS